jgi:hypothetical protein
MAEQDAQLLEVLICQFGENVDLDSVLCKALRVLGHAERYQPLPDRGHRLSSGRPRLILHITPRRKGNKACTPFKSGERGRRQVPIFVCNQLRQQRVALPDTHRRAQTINNNRHGRRDCRCALPNISTASSQRAKTLTHGQSVVAPSAIAVKTPLVSVGALGPQTTLSYQMRAWEALSVAQRPLLALVCRTTSTGVYLRAMLPFRQRLGGASGSLPPRSGTIATTLYRTPPGTNSPNSGPTLTTSTPSSFSREMDELGLDQTFLIALLRKGFLGHPPIASPRESVRLACIIRTVLQPISHP